MAGLGVGLALQGVLSNVMAGLSIIFSKPYKVGEHISLLGVHGDVVVIDIFTTTLMHADRSRVIIPNKKIVGDDSAQLRHDPSAAFVLPCVKAQSTAHRSSGISSKFGLFSIRERMRTLGGWFEIESARDKGTTVIMRHVGRERGSDSSHSSLLH